MQIDNHVMSIQYVAEIRYKQEHEDELIAQTLPCKTEEKARFHAGKLLDSMQNDAESQRQLNEILDYRIVITSGDYIDL